jgi:hypothetical protein
MWTTLFDTSRSSITQRLIELEEHTSLATNVHCHVYAGWTRFARGHHIRQWRRRSIDLARAVCAFLCGTNLTTVAVSLEPVARAEALH